MAEVIGTKYCLIFSDCPAGQSYAIPIYVNPVIDGGYPPIYDQIFPGLATNTFPGVNAYLCNITDPNFTYSNIIMRGICWTGDGYTCTLCDQQDFTVVLDPASIQIVMGPVDPGMSCPDTDCVFVENCETSSEFMIIPQQYNMYLGATLKFVEFPGKCWLAKHLSFCTDDVVNVTIDSVCKDCSECIPPPVVPFVRTEPKPDLNFSGITVIEQTINDTVRFANSYYSVFMQLQYGIVGPQNNIDPDKFWIKKQLINLEMSKLADSCTIPETVIPTVCEEPPQSEPLPVPESEI